MTMIYFCQKLPSPRTDFILEVIAERPVAQHLEEGVVVDVLADIVLWDKFNKINGKLYSCFSLQRKVLVSVCLKSYFLRSEKKVGLLQIVICSKQGEF